MSLDFFGSAVRSDSPATLPNERTRFAVPLRIKINFAYYIVFSESVKRGRRGAAPWGAFKIGGHEKIKGNAEIADYSQNTQKQASMCHLRPILGL